MSRFPSGTSFSVNISPNKTVANNTPTSITLHWWDDPSRRPSFGGVVSWFNNRSAQVSAHYVVEANRITQMVLEKDTAWHSGNSNGNRLSVGIEVNPRLNAGDYETTAQLVAEIWSRLGKIPVRRHSYWTNTACPGSMDVNRIIRRAEQIRSGSSSSPAPTEPPVLEGEVMSWNFRGLDYVNDDPSTKNAQLARAHEYGWNVWRRIRSNEWADWLARRFWTLTNTTSETSAAVHNRRGDFRFRGLDYVNENPATKDAQLARAHQYAFEARREAREANAKLDALADVLSEAVSDSVREAFKAKIEDIKAESAKVQAADVAAELEVSVRDDEDE